MSNVSCYYSRLDSNACVLSVAGYYRIGIPYQEIGDSNQRVLFPHRLTTKMIQKGNKNFVYQFTKAKITRVMISEHPERYVMLVRPSLRRDLARIAGIDGGNFIYSMWEGYLQNSYAKCFVDYLSNRSFTLHKIHTSGHADTKTLQKMVETMNPKHLVPIHTFKNTSYHSLFDFPVVDLDDGEEVVV